MKQLLQKPAVLAFWATSTLSIVGMVFQFLLLKNFDLNYFNYAEASDTLIAAGIAFSAVFDLFTNSQLLTFAGILIYFIGMIILLPLSRLNRERKIDKLTAEQRRIIERQTPDSKTDAIVEEIEANIQKLEKNLTFSKILYPIALPYLWLVLVSISLLGLSDSATGFMKKVSRAEVRPVDLKSLTTSTTIPKPAPGNKFYLVASTKQFYFVYERNDPRGNNAESSTSITHVIPRNAVTLSMNGLS